MATPRLPPTENTDIAVERRSPESQAANLLASGWNAATPTLEASTHRSASSKVWTNASSADAHAGDAPGPATSSQSPRRLSKRCPKNGCTTDDATVAASMMAAVRV